ncbi:MAG: membrane dipeptidase [Actinobacteria bacterium]|nr:membrane dipeptidase [Actinomycetota bacterium]
MAKIEKYVDHIDYIVEKVGIEHVGIGHLGLDKDLAQVFSTVTSGHYKRYYKMIKEGFPPDLQDINQFNALIEELLRRGYKDRDIKLILGGNFLRVMRQVLK